MKFPFWLDEYGLFCKEIHTVIARTTRVAEIGSSILSLEIHIKA